MNKLFIAFSLVLLTAALFVVSSGIFGESQISVKEGDVQNLEVNTEFVSQAGGSDRFTCASSGGIFATPGGSCVRWTLPSCRMVGGQPQTQSCDCDCTQTPCVCEWSNWLNCPAPATKCSCGMCS